MRSFSLNACRVLIIALGIAASANASAGRMDATTDDWWRTNPVLTLEFASTTDRLDSQLAWDLLGNDTPGAQLDDNLRQRVALDMVIQAVRDGDIAPPETTYRRRRLLLLWLWRQRQQEQIDSPAPLALILFGGLALAYHRRRH